MTGSGGLCPNCQRPLTSRECAAPEHREARGFPAEEPGLIALPTGTAECSTCLKVWPIADFWDNRAALCRKTCHRCRWRKKHQGRRTLNAKAKSRAERASADDFWAEQAAAHP